MTLVMCETNNGENYDEKHGENYGENMCEKVLWKLGENYGENMCEKCCENLVKTWWKVVEKVKKCLH